MKKLGDIYIEMMPSITDFVVKRYGEYRELEGRLDEKNRWGDGSCYEFDRLKKMAMEDSIVDRRLLLAVTPKGID